MTESKPVFYQLTCTEEQLKLIYRATEQFFRTRMGQFWDFTDDLIFDENFKPNKEDPNYDTWFNDLIQRRDDAKELFEQAYRKACPGIRYKTHDEQAAIDIWEHIRYQRWLDAPEPKLHDSVDSRPPLDLAGLPPVQVQRTEPVKRILFDTNKGTFVCSKCNRQDHADQLAKFCRYCGAKFTDTTASAN